jgi:bifunctional enzyme CysN/CysC
VVTKTLRVLVCDGADDGGRDGLAARLREQGAARAGAPAFTIVEENGAGAYANALVRGQPLPDVAVIAIDASQGAGPDARREAFFAALFGVRHLIFAVTETATVGFDERAFSALARSVRGLAADLEIPSVDCVPASALLDVIAAGDQVAAATPDAGAAGTAAGEGVVAGAADAFQATIVWIADAPLLRGRSYGFTIGASAVTATVNPIKYRMAVTTADRIPAKRLSRGEVGVCDIQVDAPVAFDPFRVDRATGSFVLTDRVSDRPVGVGMLTFALRRAQNVRWQPLSVSKAARAAVMGQRPCVLWYTGLSGAGKSTIANLVDGRLHAVRHSTYVLDGDNVRHGLNRDLGFTDADRVENIRRVAEVARLMVDAGLIVSTAFISPFRAERDMARNLLGEGEFIEIFVATPLAEVERRDPKGLYKKARRGVLKNFTGIDSPYEPPEHPELTIDTTTVTAEAAADRVIAYLRDRGFLRPSDER